MEKSIGWSGRQLIVLVGILCIFSTPKKVLASSFLVPNSAVYGTVIGDTDLLKYKGSNEVIGKLRAGMEVEIISDRSQMWYEVKTKENIIGYIEGSALEIPAAFSVDDSMPTHEQWEKFVNQENFDSVTKFFIITDISRQKVIVFKGEKNNWSVEKEFSCSTGKNESPTRRGMYTLQERGDWFYSNSRGSGGKYWIRIFDTYLFHSVAMDKHRNITDPVVGERRSDGCIRLLVPDISWIYINVPDRTTVYIR